MFGLFLLRKVKVKFNNQPLISKHLAVCELLICIEQVIKGIFELVNCHSTVTLQYIEMFARAWLALMFISIMFCIALDRVLAVYLHMKYYIIFTHCRTSKLLNAIWMINTISTIVFVLIARYGWNYQSADLFAFYFFFVLDVLFTLVALLTYCYLYSKVKHFSRRANSSSLSDKTRQRRTRKALLPCLLIGTYTFMNVPSSVMFMIAYYGLLPLSLSTEICLTLVFCSLISDGLLYIILQKDVRKVLSNIIGFNSMWSARNALRFQGSSDKQKGIILTSIKQSPNS